MSRKICGTFFLAVFHQKENGKNDFFIQKTILVSQVFNKINY
jgi:hypothetical protein